MGCCACVRLTQSVNCHPSTLLVYTARATSDPSHEPQIRCQHLLPAYNTVTLHATTTPGRSSAIILSSPVFLRGAGQHSNENGRRFRKHGRRRYPVDPVFFTPPSARHASALKTEDAEAQAKQRHDDIQLTHQHNTFSLDIDSCAPVAYTRFSTPVLSNQFTAPSICHVIPSLAWSESLAQVYRQYRLLCDGRGADNGLGKSTTLNSLTDTTAKVGAHTRHCSLWTAVDSSAQATSPSPR